MSHASRIAAQLRMAADEADDEADRRRFQARAAQLESACFCGGAHESWEYHSPEGCGRDASAFEMARNRDIDSWRTRA